MTVKGDLYREIHNYLRNLVAPPDVSELKLWVATACFDFNLKNADYLEGIDARQAALRMADEYIDHLNLYVRAIGTVPIDYKGDFVIYVTHGGHSECKCLLQITRWFMCSGNQGEELAIDRLKAF